MSIRPKTQITQKINTGERKAWLTLKLNLYACHKHEGSNEQLLRTPVTWNLIDSNTIEKQTTGLVWHGLTSAFPPVFTSVLLQQTWCLAAPVRRLFKVSFHYISLWSIYCSQFYLLAMVIIVKTFHISLWIKFIHRPDRCLGILLTIHG